MVAFGRLPQFDSRSRDYPIRAALGPRRVPRDQYWPCIQVLDQGTEGACVGFSCAHELIAEPFPFTSIDDTYARHIYKLAQQLDAWDGEDYSGTSVLAGMKALVDLGWVTQYRWAFDLSDVLETLSYLGPVILGVDWYQGMLDVNADGYVDVSGAVVGGHAILARGVQVEEQSVLLVNSWGPDWGTGGTAKISWGDLDRLLHDGGEACIPTIRVAQNAEPIVPEPAGPVNPPGCRPLAKVGRVLRRWNKRKAAV